MIPITTSGEIMAEYAKIDMCYYALRDLKKEIDKPIYPIALAIDKATGYDKHRQLKTINTGIDLIKQVIKSKKIIDADYSGDERFKNELLQLKKSLKTK